MTLFHVGVAFVIAMVYVWTIPVRCAILSDWHWLNCSKASTVNTMLIVFVLASLFCAWLIGKYIAARTGKTWAGVVTGLVLATCVFWYWHAAEFEFQDTGIERSSDDDPAYRR